MRKGLRLETAGLMLSGVLYRWFHHLTRLSANSLMPHALKTQTLIRDVAIIYGEVVIANGKAKHGLFWP